MHNRARPPRADEPSNGCSGRLMLIGLDRVHYAGLLGAPAVRTLGALAVYASVHAPFRIIINGGVWRTARVAVVPPYAPHRIAGHDRSIYCSLIEPESVDVAYLQGFLRTANAPARLAELAWRIPLAYTRLQVEHRVSTYLTTDLDELFFGVRLTARHLDTRIAGVVAAIKRNPCDRFTAEDAAAAARFSFSRFLHLFRAEVGTTFRAFRAWKRARNLLHYVTQTSTLTRIALEAGYPDATHFSHEVRRVYGLTPRDIFAGSRRLSVYAGADSLSRTPASVAPLLGAPAGESPRRLRS